MAKKRKTYIERLNWDAEFIQDIMSGNGFKITEPSSVTSETGKEKSLYGLYSPLYGTDYADEQAFVERYRCKCGYLTGKVFENELCPKCGSKVVYKDINIKFTGWISFEKYKLINPYWYQVLNKALGTEKKVNILKSIINSKQIVDINGQRSKYDPEVMGDIVTHPFVGVGMLYLREHFDEVLDYFENKKPKSKSKIEMIRRERQKVWCNKIPVYSTFMRPMSSTSETLYYTQMDKQLSPLFSISQSIKHAEEIEVDNLLTRAQERLNAYWDINFKLINGKQGWIRQNICGGSLNNTSRNVIIPDPSLKENEVVLSYHTFIELFKFQIIASLRDYGGMSLADADKRWASAYYKFDPLVYETMNQIIKEQEPMVIINRNPTLNYYSILRMKIIKIKSDFDDYTMSVPLSILPGLNADFDG